MRFLKKDFVGFLGACFLSIVFTACLEELGDIDNIGDYELSPAVAVPIAYDVFNFEDFVTSGNRGGIIQINEDGSIVVVYQEMLASQSGGNIFALPDQTVGATLSIDPADQSPVPVTATVTNQQDYQGNFSPADGEEFDSLRINRGDIRITVSSDFPADGDYTITIPSLKKNGSVFQRTLSSTFSGSPVVVTRDDQITDYTFDLSDGGLSTNTIDFSLEIVLSFQNQPILLSNFVSATVEFRNIELSAAFGLLTPKQINTSDTINIDLFDNATDGGFILNNPIIKFTFDNSFGAPVEVDFSNIQTLAPNGNSVPISGTITQTNPIIDAPPISQVGSSVITEVVLDSTNSNVQEMIAIAPNLLIYGLNGTVNPNSLSNVFVLDTSEVDITMDLELPLVGFLINLSVENTFGFNGEDVKNLDSLIFLIRTENDFPFDVSLQGYFEDDANNVIDSLFIDETKIILGAPIDNNGITIFPERDTTEVTLGLERLTNISTASNIRIKAVLDTEDKSLGVILDTYFLEVDIGATFEVIVDNKEN